MKHKIFIGIFYLVHIIKDASTGIKLEAEISQESNPEDTLKPIIDLELDDFPEKKVLEEETGKNNNAYEETPDEIVIRNNKYIISDGNFPLRDISTDNILNNSDKNLLTVDFYYVTGNSMNSSNFGKPVARHRGLGDQDCELGSFWSINCYDCHCGDDWKFVCERKGGCLPPPIDQPKLCKPYTRFYLDKSHCQKCECNGDGVPVCAFDYYGCSKKHEGLVFYINGQNAPLRYYPKNCPTSLSQMTVLRKCRPNTEWTARCFHCKCDELGQPTCYKVTEKCEPPPFGTPARCKPGSQPAVAGCMQCFCNDDGELQARTLWSE